MRSFTALFLLALVVSIFAGCGSGSDSSSEDAPLAVGQTSFDSSGGQTTLTLNVPDGTSWSATSPSTWVTLDRYAGTGSTTMQVKVDRNIIPGDRRANISIAGQQARIVQTAGSGAVPVTYRSASFELPDTMTGTTPGAWTYASPDKLLELKVGSDAGHVDLNAIETSYAALDAAHFKLRRRTLIHGLDAYMQESVPDQNGVCKGTIWLNHKTDWYVFATKTKNADLLYVLTTSLQFPQ